MNKSGNGFGLSALATLLLAALLGLAGCGGEFWGGLGDWEPGELGAAPPGGPRAPSSHQGEWSAPRRVVLLQP